MLVLALAAAAGATVTTAWWIDRRKGGERNAQGSCASCGVGWAETLSDEPYLIHGRLVCEACAAKAKRRMPWHFGILGASAATATGGIVAGQGAVAMVVFPAGVVVAMTWGAVRVMRLANRDAQRRIAEGEFPDFEAVRSAAGADPARALSEGAT